MQLALAFVMISYQLQGRIVYKKEGRQKSLRSQSNTVTQIIHTLAASCFSFSSQQAGFDPIILKAVSIDEIGACTSPLNRRSLNSKHGASGFYFTAPFVCVITAGFVFCRHQIKVIVCRIISCRTFIAL